ncbi:MAG TPA: hypothetical protein ENG87_05720 [Candidatus Pacearchaeota archaeon]|nr:hypothetical protein BMS3Abin17_00508 [archaeon BMS3Abin17]HDK42855.1 hypothetical protein [Candidatus Pacearchaeota archaeon]HDZ61119.1 hypothetical protein [Candidatus Pacearchaeota archaeon]
MSQEINRIVILEKNVFGDLKRCPICGINFTAIEPCILCALRIEKEKELGRKLTRGEFREITSFLD